MIFSKKVSAQENMEFVLRDKDGKVKKLFQPFSIVSKFIKKFGIQCPKFFPFGYWTTSLKVSNLITNAGLAALASRCNGSGSEAVFTHVALGIGMTAATVADTQLGSEITTSGGERSTTTVSRSTTTIANDTAQYVYSWTFTAPLSVTESGIFNAGVAGTMLARNVFAYIDVTGGDALQVTWKVKFSYIP